MISALRGFQWCEAMVCKFTSLPFDSLMADTPFNHELSPLGMQSRRQPSIFNPIRNWLLCLLYVHLIPVAVQAQDRQLFYCADIYRTVLIIEKYIMIVCNSVTDYKIGSLRYHQNRRLRVY